jgi:hypothetical protein
MSPSTGKNCFGSISGDIDPLYGLSPTDDGNRFQSPKYRVLIKVYN